MKAFVREALSAASSESDRRIMLGRPARFHSIDRVRQIVHMVVSELPDDMTIAELRDELDNAQSQEIGASR